MTLYFLLDALSSAIPSSSQRAFDGSEVDTDDEATAVENAWKGDSDSDAESVDSDLEDPLKYVKFYFENMFGSYFIYFLDMPALIPPKK